MARWLLVANPSAQSGAAAGRMGAAVAALAAVGIPVELLTTVEDVRTSEAVDRALRGGSFRGVIAMGGDGTFHEVANGLLRSGLGPPLGLIPAGTGNNQARSLGLPIGDLDAAAARIASGRRASMDGALLGDVYQGELVYAGAAVRALVASYFEDHRFDANVITEQRTFFYEDLHDLIVNNTRVYARAWVMDPTSRHDDGEMELLPIHGMDEWATHALVSLDGNPLREWMDAENDTPIVRGARFAIELVGRPGEPDIQAQVDGEPWPTVGRVQVEVHRAVLSIAVGATGVQPA